jgi:hypothetical protein
MRAFFSELELSVRGKDRGLTEGQTMCLYEHKAVRILSQKHERIGSQYKSKTSNIIVTLFYTISCYCTH